MVDAKIRDVSDTALWVAAYRAQESARPDAAFKDPLASLLLGERGEAISRAMPGREMMQWLMVIRTVAIDRLIMKAVSEGADMVLNIGAGLDTRPYRLDLPASLRWIEMDFENIVAMKNEKLKDQSPKCQLQRITLDITNAEARKRLVDIAAGAKFVVVLTEGLIMYLDTQVVSDFADDLRSMSNLRYWVQDHYMMRSNTRASRPWRNALAAAPFKFKAPNWIEFFTQRHWQVVERIRLIDEAGRLRRRPPVSWWQMLLFSLLPPRMRKRMQDATGYLMLKPD
jgi:methyltransferase (TIGR00027 family)